MSTRKKYPYPLNYRGNVFLLILSIFFPPLAVALLIKNLAIQYKNSQLYLEYRGGYGWIIFWTLVFFPLAVVLLLIRGIDLVEETHKK